MTARTARRISQPDSRCVPNRNAVLNKEKRRWPAATTACAALPPQALPRAFRGQNPKGRSVLDRTAPAASFRASPRRVDVRVLQSASARSEVNTRFRD